VQGQTEEKCDHVLGGVIDDDFPAVVCVFDDEREEAIGRAAFSFTPFKAISSGDDGEVFVERMDFEVGEGESAHGGSVGIVALIFFEQTGETAEDLVGDEESIGRVFKTADVTGEVAFVPGVLLGEEDLDDVELLARGGVEGIGGLRTEECWGKKAETESKEAYRGAKHHKGSQWESWFVWRHREGMSHKKHAQVLVGLIVADQDASCKSRLA